MSLFTKSIDKIRIEDVEAFCNAQMEEGIKLDYKREIQNKSIAKAIAAFANTYGGLILIGVDEQDRKPKTPIHGIDYTDGLNERITSIAYKAINPPVHPEIQVCQFEKDPSKAVVVVRVHESNETPHRIEQDTETFIRINSQSEPVKAPFEQIEWLMNRREKSIKNRERLLRRAHERLLSKYNGLSFDISSMPSRGMSIIPLYPSGEIVKYSEIPCHVSETAIRASSSIYDFPYNSCNPISLQEGVVCCNTNFSDYEMYTEINSYGLIFHKENLLEDRQTKTNSIDILITLEKIYLQLFFAKQFYKRIGYWGLIQISLNFEKIKGRGLVSGSSSRPANYNNTFDMNLTLERIKTVSDLTDTFESVVLDLFKEFLWSFNWKDTALNDEQMRSHLEKTKISLKREGINI